MATVANTWAANAQNAQTDIMSVSKADASQLTHYVKIQMLLVNVPFAILGIK